MNPSQTTETRKTVGQMLKFTLFSASAGILEVVICELLLLMGLDYWLCYLPALVASVLYNFTFNRRYTFRSAANVPIAMLKVAGFYAVFTPLSTWGGHCLTGIGWNETAVLILTMLLNFVLEFLYCRCVVYRGTVDTNELAVGAKPTDDIE